MATFQCSLCPRSFSMIMNKARHMRSMHGVDSRTHLRASGVAGAPATSQPERAPGPSAAADLGQPASRGPPHAELPCQDRSGPSHGRTPAGSENADYVTAVESQMAELMATRTRAEPTVQPEKRRRVVGQGADNVREYRYATLATELRAAYENLRDWARSTPIVEARKRCRPGLFDSYRLRALQRFCLTVCGGAGLTLAEQDELYNLLDIWEGTKPGMPVDAGHDAKLRDIFKSSNAFKNAFRDDIDAALLDTGWRKCTMVQNGDTLTGVFLPVLDVILKEVCEGQNVRLWSGDDGPAPPTAMRETPMDGDAFRLNEAEVVKEHGLGAFVLGIHGYSDATQLSRSGCEWAARPVRL